VIEPGLLWLYFVTVLGVIALPGMDMAFVLGSSIGGGRAAGLSAVAGIVAGGFCHMLLGATGLGIVLQVMPAALNAMLFAGGAYIAWIGWRLLRANSATGLTLATRSRTHLQNFSGAMATCLLNPKAYLFMLAIFPQFVRAERGSIWAQASVLALITACTQVAVYSGVALAAARAATALNTRPALQVRMMQAVGALLLVAAAFTTWRGLAL